MHQRKEQSSGSDVVELPDPVEVERRLEQLGISLQTLQSAARRGQNAYDFASSDAYPVTAAGLSCWIETNAAIREEQGILGWSFNNDDNIPRVVSPDKSVVITAVSGDSQTGLRDSEHPASTNRPRRAAGMRIVSQNNQLVLRGLFESEESDDSTNAMNLGPTWFFLYHRDGDIVRSELSLAVKVSETGVLVGWRERLVLPEINMLDGGSGVRNQPDNAPDVDIPVERRAS